MTLRRQPLQARSRARIDQILDAADQVFLEMGYDAATTNHIAARAGVSIGGLYRFFPDKDALLVALAERYGAKMAALGAEVTTPDQPGLTLAERVGRGIDAFNALLVAHPGFQTLIEQARHPALVAGLQAQDAGMSGLIGGTLLHLRPKMDPAERAIIATVTNLVLGTLQTLSLRGDDAHRAAVVAEAKVMVSADLSRRLGIPEDVPLS